MFFDDIIVKEYDPKGNFVRELISEDFSSVENWNFWSTNNTGNSHTNNTEGHNDNTSLSISQTTDDSNFANYPLRIYPKPDYSYQISGWMKGTDVNSKNKAQIRLDFYNTKGDFYVRDKNFLEYDVDKLHNWAQNKNAPLYMGEFGTGAPTFKDGKGGKTYVKDLIDLAYKKEISFTYHSYKGDFFGIYENPSLPSNKNQPLIDLFKAELK